MKKLLCCILILVTVTCCLCACNFTQNLSGAMAGAAECTPLVKEMITFLAEEETESAKLLLHPQASKRAADGIEQMEEYLAGRNGKAEMISINVNTSTGTSGKIRQEQVGYKVTLEDGEIIYLNVVYRTDNDNAGFLSFQVVLGIV